ncbi:MAG: hypothetical protein JKY32_13950 [Rhizobiales bacterium]|nr:hypothetical protein [Hyphomicrobiales bacterium]
MVGTRNNAGNSGIGVSDAGVSGAGVSDASVAIVSKTESPVAREIIHLAGSLPDPCFLLHPDGRVIFQNPPAEESFGQIQSGASIYALLRAPEVKDTIEHCVATAGSAHIQYFERVPNEKLLDVFVARLGMHTGLVNDENPPIMLLLRDLTQQHRLDRMRADFVANASHELRTPLASLTGFIETLKGSAKHDTAAREQFLDIMETQANRMSRLINDLLSLSLIEMNVDQRPDDIVDLKEVAAHIIDTLKPISERSGVKVTLEALEQNYLVPGARDELVQVVQNLVENAIKYGQDGKLVDVSITNLARIDAPDEILFTVRDAGPGIAPENIPRLTERFYRVDVASSREKGGTGLGLAIVKHILNRHRSGLKITSKPGDGATFSFILEAVSDAKQSP